MQFLILSALFGTLATVASAANFSGRWVIQTPGRGGQMISTTIVLNQVGNEVSGNIVLPARISSASPINTEVIDGKVEGDTISFYVWTGSDEPVKAMYKGTMSGDEIKFTVTGGVTGPGGGGQRGQAAPREVIARRAR